MTLDADRYRLNVSLVEYLTKDKSPKERLELISLLAVTTGVPVIITACYIGELYGFNEEILKRIERLKDFYKIKEVLNVKSDSKV